MDRDMEQLPLRLKNVTERHTTVSMDRDMEQPPQRLKDVTEQRDTLLCQQDMGEVIHATPNMMTKARNTQGEREERIVENYATIESLRDQHQDYVGTEETSNTLGTVRSQQLDPVSPPLCPIRAVVVLLVLLSVALLAGLLGLAVKYKIVMEKNNGKVSRSSQHTLTAAAAAAAAAATAAATTTAHTTAATMVTVNMAEVIHARPNMIFKAWKTQGDGEEGIEDDYDSMESLRDQHQDYVEIEESSNTLGTARGQQPDPVSPPRCPIRAVVVLLVLLSVVLLAGLLRFAVQHKTIMEKTVSMNRDLEQLLQRLKNVTEQRESSLCKLGSPNGWDNFGCKCYCLSKVWGFCNECRGFCVSNGADLVVVDSKEEMDFISRYGGYFWLGATDKASAGLWRWVDGTVLSVDNPSWSRGKPDGGKEKNCLREVREKTNYEWTDERCEARDWGL
ncbi:unnamed protein product [Gadus morhua 'NCC']